MSMQIVREFDAEMRAFPPNETGQCIERIGGVVRTRGDYNTILFAELDPGDVDAAVAEQAAFFSGRGEEVEWKLYAHDTPANLSSALAAHGFQPGEPETLMAMPLTAEATSAVPAPGIEVRVVTTSEALATYLEVATAAFGKPPTLSAAQYELRLFGERAETIASIAYVDSVPATAGRLELPRDRSFASLWGGGTVPLLRGRGAYRALVIERARVARERGYAYVTVDALRTSRPILERVGFRPLTTIRAWVLDPRTKSGSEAE